MINRDAEPKGRLPAKASHLARWGAAALVAVLWTTLPAQAQFAHVPTPLVAGAPRTSEAETEQAYRRDAAKRIYESFPMHIYRGKMPALAYAIAITETDIGADGQVTDVRLTREPAAAKEVGPWVVALIRRVGQMPPMARMAQVTYTETWLVDKSGKFQLHSLTEGQRGE
jgi:hypothetical protein